MGGLVGETVAAERGGAVDAEVVLVVLALPRVRGARVEELLRQQAAQPLRSAAHGRRLHGGCPSSLWPIGAPGSGWEGRGVIGLDGGREGSCRRSIAGKTGWIQRPKNAGPLVSGAPILCAAGSEPPNLPRSVRTHPEQVQFVFF